jgi:hypothetical protein
MSPIAFPPFMLPQGGILQFAPLSCSCTPSSSRSLRIHVFFIKPHFVLGSSLEEPELVFRTHGGRSLGICINAHKHKHTECIHLREGYWTTTDPISHSDQTDGRKSNIVIISSYILTRNMQFKIHTNLPRSFPLQPWD